MYDYINALMHLIFDDPNEFIRILFLSRDNFSNYKQWLKNRNIEFEWFKSINDTNFGLVSKRSSIMQIEALLHIDIQSELDIFISSEQKNMHYILINVPKEKNLSFKMEDRIYYLNIDLNDESYLFTNPCKALNFALFHADHWPGILSIKNDEYYFSSLIENQTSSDETYFVHLSDLHLGTRKNNIGKISLFRSLDNLISTLKFNTPSQILITGDLMNSPNRKNMYLASGFMNDLKKRYHTDLTFILGNHDMIVHGLNFLRVQKAKVVAYLLAENIKVLEKEKIILIKINSAYEGNLARGKVGELQLKEIDDELAAISNLSDYQLIALIHHHVFPIDKADFLKKKWKDQKVINKILDSSKELVDSDLLINWLNKRHIKYICHGHKHIPYFRKHNQFYVIACGSSCGVIKESKIKYLSYNVLKYDKKTKQMKLCLIYYDSMTDNNKRVELHLMKSSRRK